jgi:hypothetical protein
MNVYFPSWAVMALPEVGDRNEFKRAALAFLYMPGIFQGICPHDDWDIVSLDDGKGPVYCCHRCDKVGDYVNY